MKKQHMIIAAIAAVAIGGYLYTRKRGGVSKVTDAIKARFAASSAAAASPPDDKDASESLAGESSWPDAGAVA